MNVLLQVWTGSICFPQRRSKSGMECRANSGKLANNPWPWANIYTHWAPRSCVILTVSCTMSLNRSALSDWWEVWLRCYSVTCQVGNTCFCQTVLSIIRVTNHQCWYYDIVIIKVRVKQNLLLSREGITNKLLLNTFLLTPKKCHLLQLYLFLKISKLTLSCQNQVQGSSLSPCQTVVVKKLKQNYMLEGSRDHLNNLNIK